MAPRIISLADDGEEVLTLFTEWAYSRGYSHKHGTPSPKMGKSTEPKQDPWLLLRKHLQLYIFSKKSTSPP